MSKILLLAVFIALVSGPVFAGPSGVSVHNQVVMPPQSAIRVVPGYPPPLHPPPLYVAQARNLRGEWYIGTGYTPQLAVDFAMAGCTQGSWLICGCGVVSIRAVLPSYPPPSLPVANRVVMPVVGYR